MPIAKSHKSSATFIRRVIRDFDGELSSSIDIGDLDLCRSHHQTLLLTIIAKRPVMTRVWGLDKVGRMVVMLNTHSGPIFAYQHGQYVVDVSANEDCFSCWEWYKDQTPA